MIRIGGISAVYPIKFPGFNPGFGSANERTIGVWQHHLSEGFSLKNYWERVRVKLFNPCAGENTPVSQVLIQDESIGSVLLIEQADLGLGDAETGSGRSFVD